MAEDELLRNVVLSSNPCPICVDAAEQEPMTLKEWAASEWGLPGSSARYCEDDCHCLLIPEAVLPEFPAISEKAKLRGEEGSAIRATVELAPSEQGLKGIMDQWNENIGKLPPEIYKMDLYKVEAYLRKLYAEIMGGEA